jgi:hypothetical protein
MSGLFTKNSHPSFSGAPRNHHGVGYMIQKFHMMCMVLSIGLGIGRLSRNPTPDDKQIEFDTSSNRNITGMSETRLFQIWSDEYHLFGAYSVPLAVACEYCGYLYFNQQIYQDSYFTKADTFQLPYFQIRIWDRIWKRLRPEEGGLLQILEFEAGVSSYCVWSLHASPKSGDI